MSELFWFVSCTLWAHNLAEVEPHSSSRVYQLMDLSNLYLLAYYDIIVFISNLALRFTRINISPIFLPLHIFKAFTMYRDLLKPYILYMFNSTIMQLFFI